MKLPNMLGQSFERKEEISDNAAPPTKLLIEQDGKGIRNGGPAQSIVVDVSAIATQQSLMREEPVFTLAYGNAEPVAGADGRLDFEQQVAADGEKASADATDTPRPILWDLVELKCRIIDKGLNCCNDVVGGVSDSNSAPNRAHFRLGEARGQFANCIRVKDAIGIDRNDDLGCRVLYRIADRACLSAVEFIAFGTNVDVGEVALRLLHPLVAVIDRAVILRKNFELVIRVVAPRYTFDRFVDGFAFVVARHHNADSRLVRIVLLGFRARKRKPHNDAHQVLHEGNQERKDEDKP